MLVIAMLGLGMRMTTLAATAVCREREAFFAILCLDSVIKDKAFAYANNKLLQDTSL